VFTPSILTILGVIMYLRLGWVVGNVGLARTLLIITIATSITLLTGLSIAAIATDQRVRIGGAYYMISRSLGLETGGAVGIPLFLAQALSVALYVVGFAESVVAVFPALDQRSRRRAPRSGPST
jgi:amino acid transporter